MIRAALVFFLGFSLWAVAADPTEASPRLVVHLLDYIAGDYAGAVKDGKVIKASEYQEQIEFINSAMETSHLVPELKNSTEILADLKRLQVMVQNKDAADQVSDFARQIESKIIQTVGLQVAPTQWPSRESGKQLYAQGCTVCHGVTGHGDGTVAASLDPKPSDFFAPKGAGTAPFQAFNAIRLGVPGTPMPSFSGFTDSEVWDLAFYVTSLRHEGNASAATFPAGIELKDVATLSDEDLLKKLPGDEATKGALLARVRLQPPTTASAQSSDFVALAKSRLRQAQTLVSTGDFSSAKKQALLAYLDGVEPIEPRLRTKDPSFTIALEEKMAAVRWAIEKRQDTSSVAHRVEEATSLLDQADLLLQQVQGSAWVTFSLAAGIFLREAFEAALIIITLLGVLRSLGSRKAALVVHGGWMLAVAVGIVCWYFSGWVMAMSGAHRETMEGVISLTAVVVLLYLGFWMHRRTEIGRWKAFLQDMVKSAVEEKNLIALGSVAFMAVFREAFETVLFLRALLIESGGNQQVAVLAGVGLSFALVMILASAIVHFSAKVPVRQLFQVSSWVMVLLAMILVGKAVHAFQESGWLTITAFPIQVRWDLLGFYPTYETIVPQLVLLTTTGLVWLLGRRPSLTEQSL